MAVYRPLPAPPLSSVPNLALMNVNERALYSTNTTKLNDITGLPWVRRFVCFWDLDYFQVG